MRTLDQCKAEVLNRSQEIIKKRKAIRRYVIAACIPLVLLIGVSSATLLPSLTAKSTNDAAAPMEILTDENKHSYSGTGNMALHGGDRCALFVEGQEYPLSQEDGEALIAILEAQDYNPIRVCKCLPQFRIVTESGSYGIHLAERYARCDLGQSKLTPEQTEQISEIYCRVTGKDIPKIIPQKEATQ